MNDTMENARSKMQRRCTAAITIPILITVCVLLLAGCSALNKNGSGLESAA